MTLLNVKGRDDEFDVYVAYASEDRPAVTKLVQGLEQNGLRVWFDQHALLIGKSLRAQMDLGLSRSAFGVIVLSSAFFAKNWTAQELDGLLALETADEPRVLPVWYRVNHADVLRYSPILAGRKAAVIQTRLADVVPELVRSISLLRADRGDLIEIIRGQTAALPWRSVEFFEQSLRRLNNEWISDRKTSAGAELIGFPEVQLLGARLDGLRISLCGHQDQLQHFATAGGTDEWVFQMFSNVNNSMAYVRYRHPDTAPPPQSPPGHLTWATGYVIARGHMMTVNPDGTPSAGRNCVYIMADHVWHHPKIADPGPSR